MLIGELLMASMEEKMAEASIVRKKTKTAW
jgi:hypothetical protein